MLSLEGTGEYSSVKMCDDDWIRREMSSGLVISVECSGRSGGRGRVEEVAVLDLFGSRT